MIISREINNLVKRYSEGKLAHAFLLETNNMESCYKDVLNLIKVLNCNTEFKEECLESCNLCNLIDNLSLPSLIVINPDGASIKKGQVLELKERFATKPVYSRFNCYVINNCEKLNSSSANTMLKFLEEPTDDIIGFFITDNKENVINTIKSRCQIISVNYDDRTELVLTTEFVDYLNSVVKEDYDVMYVVRKDFIESVGERNGLEDNFKVLEELLVLNFRYLLGIGKQYEYFNEAFFRIVTEKNSDKIMQIVEKILLMIKSNVNIDLILDYFYFEVRDFND